MHRESLTIPPADATDRQLLLAIYRTQTRIEDHMSRLTELTAQIRTGIDKERADHATIVEQLRATLEDRALTAEAARDQALSDLAAALSTHSTAEAELDAVLVDLAANDLPDESEAPAEPVDPEAPTEPEQPTEPETPDPTEADPASWSY